MEKFNRKVSIIIPTYKRPDNLARAINSVLNQTYTNIEVIVVDDNDPNMVYREETEKLMAQYSECKNIKYIRHSRNSNGAVARNTGYTYAEGEYIGFLDDDDEFERNKIQLQVEKLESFTSEYKGVYCGYKVILNGKEISRVTTLPEGNLQLDLFQMNYSLKAGSGLLVEDTVFKELGGFDESFERHQDYEFLIRFFEKYKLACVFEPLVKIHQDSRINYPDGKSFSQIKQQYLNKYFSILNKYPKKQRAIIYKNHWLEISKVFLINRDYLNALHFLIKAIKMKFPTIRNWRALFGCFIKGVLKKH